MPPRQSADDGVASNECALDARALHTASTKVLACCQLCHEDLEWASPPMDDTERWCACCSLVLLLDVASSEELVHIVMPKLPVLASEVSPSDTPGASACQLSSYSLSAGRTLARDDEADPSSPAAEEGTASGDEDERARLVRLDTCVHRPLALRMEWWLRPAEEVSDAISDGKDRQAV